MNENARPITAQEWEQIPIWGRKRLYWLARWYVFKNELKKFFRLG